MSFSLKDNPNEIPSMHMHLRQASKVIKYVKKMHEQIESEIHLCLQD